MIRYLGGLLVRYDLQQARGSSSQGYQSVISSTRHSHPNGMPVDFIDFAAAKMLGP